MKIETEWGIDWLWIIKIPFCIWLIITLPYNFRLLVIFMLVIDFNFTTKHKKIKEINTYYPTKTEKGK